MTAGCIIHPGRLHTAHGPWVGDPCFKSLHCSYVGITHHTNLSLKICRQFILPNLLLKTDFTLKSHILLYKKRQTTTNGRCKIFVCLMTISVGQTISSLVIRATTKFVTRLWTDLWQWNIYGTEGRAGSKTDIWDELMVLSRVGREKIHMSVTVTS